MNHFILCSKGIFSGVLDIFCNYYLIHYFLYDGVKYRVAQKKRPITIKLITALVIDIFE